MGLEWLVPNCVNLPKLTGRHTSNAKCISEAVGKWIDEQKEEQRPRKS